MIEEQEENCENEENTDERKPVEIPARNISSKVTIIEEYSLTKEEVFYKKTTIKEPIKQNQFIIRLRKGMLYILGIDNLP